jgi:glycosyltransferase involved in cell wall biosynthesis
VFFCLIDDFIAHLQTAFDFNRLLGRQFTGLYFRPFHLRVRPPYSWFRKGPFNPDAVLFSHYCRSVAVLDEGIAKMLSRRLNDKLVVCFPDVTDGEVSESPTDLEREVKYKAKGRRIVGLLGSLDRRKGLLTFIRHATEMKNEPIFFLIAGKIAEHSFTEEENRTLNRIMKCPPENVFAHPGFVKDGIPFNSLVRACELLYVVYHDFPHSSNLLTKAACMNVPIVASDRYLIADRVRRFSLGFLVRENVPEDFHDLILSGKAFQLKGERKFMIGCQEYSKQHGFMKLVSCFKQLLAEY